MNKFALMFLILFFLVVIVVGLLALNKQLFNKSRATEVCPIPKISENTTCPTGQTMQLIKTKAGCYAFECQ